MLKKYLLVTLGVLFLSAPLHTSEVEGDLARKENAKIGFFTRAGEIVSKPVNFAKSTIKGIYKVGNVLVYVVGVGTVAYVGYCVYNREQLDVTGLTESEFAKNLLSQKDSSGIVWTMRLPGLGHIVVIPSWLANIVNSGELILKQGQEAAVKGMNATLTASQIAAENAEKFAKQAVVVANQKAQEAADLAYKTGGELKAMGQGLNRLAQEGIVVTQKGLSSVAQKASEIGTEVQRKASELFKK